MAQRKLSVEELMKYFCSGVPELPQRGGLKENTPDDSWLQNKRLQHFYTERADLLAEERVKKKAHLAHGEWRPELGKVEIIGKAGKFWQMCGHVTNGRQYLHPEEAMSLVDKADLEVYYGGVALSVQECYVTLLADHVPIEQYQVYNHLARLGYAVFRHTPVERVTKYERDLGLNPQRGTESRKERKRKRRAEILKKQQAKVSKMDETVSPECEEKLPTVSMEEDSGMEIDEIYTEHGENMDDRCTGLSSDLTSACSGLTGNSANNIEDQTSGTSTERLGINMGCDDLCEPSEEMCVDCESITDVDKPTPQGIIHCERSVHSEHPPCDSGDPPPHCMDDTTLTPEVPHHREFMLTPEEFTPSPPLPHSDFSDIDLPCLTPGTPCELSRPQQQYLPPGVTLESDMYVIRAPKYTPAPRYSVLSSGLEYSHPVGTRRASSARNWAQYKAETHDRVGELVETPGGHLWRGDVTPLIRPEQATSSVSLLERMKIIQNMNFTQNCDMYPKSVESDEEIVYDVYKSDQRFSKTCPGLPAFRLCVLSQQDRVISLADLVTIHRQCPDGVPLQWAIVDNGAITFYTFNGVDLPTDVILQ